MRAQHRTFSPHLFSNVSCYPIFPQGPLYVVDTFYYCIRQGFIPILSFDCFFPRSLWCSGNFHPPSPPSASRSLLRIFWLCFVLLYEGFEYSNACSCMPTSLIGLCSSRVPWVHFDLYSCLPLSPPITFTRFTGGSFLPLARLLYFGHYSPCPFLNNFGSYPNIFP